MRKIIAFCVLTILIISTVVPIQAAYFDTADHTDLYISVIDDWYADAFDFVNSNELMFYVVDSKQLNPNVYYFTYYFDFCGNLEINRSEVACILHRYDGNSVTNPPHHHLGFDGQTPPYSNSTCPAFVDVPDGQNYTPAADWAYENSIINGVGDDCFAPDRTITREEFAAMLYRYTEYLEVDTTARVDYSEFADSESVSDWAHDAMSWAVAEGLINGKPGKLLAPQDTITRAEVATVIYRFNNEVKAHRDIWDGKQG